MRPAVERVDALGVAEADAAQQLLDAARLRADLADDGLARWREQRRVDFALGKQAADELLVALAEAVGLAVAEAGEVTAERFPQVAGAVGLERRQQLGQQLVAESPRAAAR